MSSTYKVYVGPYLYIPEQKGFNAWDFCEEIKGTLAPACMESKPGQGDYLLPNMDSNRPQRLCEFARNETDEGETQIDSTSHEVYMLIVQTQTERELLDRQNVKYDVRWGVVCYYI